MNVLGIESSCDECSAAVVKDGRDILSLHTVTQTEIHAQFDGVVPEVASRAHVEAIQPVVRTALTRANLSMDQIDLVAVTNQPGLSGSLTVGLSFAKAFAFARGVPFVTVDHMLAHAYAPRLVPAGGDDSGNNRIPVYPYLILLVSGGHTLIGIVWGEEELEVLGTTIDDACGEAFDKVGNYLGLDYPGGPRIDAMAREGDSRAYRFPVPKLNNANQRYDLSYSGLKTAVIHQRERFHDARFPETKANIAAAFQKAAIDMLLTRLANAVEDTGILRVAAGGGVAANSYLRQSLERNDDLDVSIPPMELCMDNGAMVAGLGYHRFLRHGFSSLDAGVNARVSDFRYRPN